MQSDFGAGALGAIIGAIVAGLFAWLAQRTKGEADQSIAAQQATAAIEVAVLAEWQKLNSALSARVSALEKQLADVRAAHGKEIDEMRTKHRAEMRQLRDLNEGLQRQIAQNSKSTAHLMGNSPVTNPKDGDDAN